MYAYIESKNERSKNLINQAGYEYIRSFLTVAFSRFSPRSDRSGCLARTGRAAGDVTPARRTIC
ncbi:MAG: hypothetical protein MZV63_12665 [Marinilabiliales bacterium]|nr:hypothetical protein [Marinilabiliales bacterium]